MSNHQFSRRDFLRLAGGAVAVGALSLRSNTSSRAAPITFSGTELLTRPTANSVSVTIVPDAAITLYYQYSTTSGGPYTDTATTAAAAGVPKTVVIGGLTPNTRYYYRMRYSTDGGSTWETRSETSFSTARAAGSTFTFTLTSDSHVNIVMGVAATWTSVCNDVLNRGAADFHLDLGDTVAMRSVDPGDVAAAEAAYEYQLQFFNIFSGSRPVFLVPGNHEQREGWHVDGTPNDAGGPEVSLPVIGVNAQKKYFPMPVPDGFYTGDSSTLSYIDGDHLRENYYAWTWGDALFVVIDPFWYTTVKPYVTDLGGGETNGTGSGDSWDWTLGQTQFNWLKTTLTNSTAKYKFIFTHQLPTDASLSSQEDYGHAGANYVHMVEMGGYNEDGTTYTWSAHRSSGWGSDPIHQILVDTGVSAVFHGHDHQYAYEIKDGVVYQSVPTSGWGEGGNGFNMYATGDGYTIQALPNTGHLRVTVAPDQTTVQYYRNGQTSPATNGTYTIEPSAAANHTVTFNANGGTGTMSPQTASAPTALTLNTFTRTGYTFGGWNTAAGGGGTAYADGATYSFATDVTLYAQWMSGSATSSAVPSDAAPRVGDTIVVTINIDVSDVGAPNDALGSFTGSLDWDPAVLEYSDDSGILAGFTGVVNPEVVTGHISFNGANPSGATGDVTVLTITFDVVGAGTSTLDLEYSAMAAAGTFANLLPLLTVTDGHVEASPAPYALTMVVDPVGSGTTEPAVGVHAYDVGSVVPITAAASGGYAFDHWTGDVANASLPTTTVTMDGDKTVTAHFVGVSHELTIAVDPVGSGTTDPAVGVHTYAEGSVVPVTATAASGYAFDYWTGDVANASSPTTTVTVDGDKTVTAHFVGVSHELTIAVDPVGSGTTDPAVGVHSYADGAVVPITATASGGYAFDHWTGDVANASSPTTTVTVDGDKIITAHFVDITLPDTGITAYPDNPSSSADASFSFISTEPGSTFECQLDGGGFSACTSPKTYTGLADGDHTFEVRAIDPSSNVDPSPASYSWTIDTVAPNTTITAYPPNPSHSVDASFSFTSTEPGSTFECQLDGGGFSTCTSPQTYTGLDYGNHTFEVRAIDGVGNVDPTPASYSWTIKWAVYLPIVKR